jgi:hypothetical protein
MIEDMNCVIKLIGCPGAFCLFIEYTLYRTMVIMAHLTPEMCKVVFLCPLLLGRQALFFIIRKGWNGSELSSIICHKGCKAE